MKDQVLLPECLQAFERVLGRRYVFTTSKNPESSIVVYRLHYDGPIDSSIKLIGLLVGKPRYDRTKIRRLKIVCDSEVARGWPTGAVRHWNKTYDLKYGRPQYRQIAARILGVLRRFENHIVIQDVIDS